MQENKVTLSVDDTNPLRINGRRDTNLLETLEAQDGAEYTRTAKGTLIKVRESDRRLNSTKANRKNKKN